MKKRVLSLILALVLCVGLLPMAASADHNRESELIDSLLPDDPGTPILSDVTKVSALIWYRADTPWPYSKSEEEYFSDLEELVNDLTRGKNSETAKARAIFEWVAKNIEYDYNTLNERWAYERINGMCTFAERKGVCEGYSYLTILMNIIAGLPTAYIGGTAKSGGRHGWTAVYVDGGWLYYDATWNEWDIGPYYHKRMGYAEVYGELCCCTDDGMLWVYEQHGFKFPDTGISRSILRIKSDAFYDCQDIERVVIPNTLEYCGERTFRECENLKILEFEEGCHFEMGNYAFARTYGLETVIIPGSIKELGASMFSHCEKLKNVTIGDGVETIKRYAFESCNSLESITLPDSVKTIEASAFEYCRNLKSIYIPSSVTSIGEKAFSIHSGTNSITIYTEPGSYAETYAKENKIKVVTSGMPTPADSSKPSAWAQAEVTAATQAGLVPGDLLSSYTSAINREEFCRLMVKLIEAESGKDIASYVTSQGKEIFAPFTDTSAQEVKAAYALGIVNGVSATKFNPSGFITRQEAAAMLERTAKLLGLTSGTGVSFADSGSIASWAADSVSFVSGLTDPTTGGRVMGGTGSGFSPLGTYTREQAIATALRLFHCAA